MAVISFEIMQNNRYRCYSRFYSKFYIADFVGWTSIEAQDVTVISNFRIFSSLIFFLAESTSRCRLEVLLIFLWHVWGPRLCKHCININYFLVQGFQKLLHSIFVSVNSNIGWCTIISDNLISIATCLVFAFDFRFISSWRLVRFYYAFKIGIYDERHMHLFMVIFKLYVFPWGWHLSLGRSVVDAVTFVFEVD